MGTFLFLFASTCIQDAFPGPQHVCTSLPDDIMFSALWWTRLDDLVCLKKRNETGSYTMRGCLGHMGTILFLCVSTCIQDAFPGSQHVCTSLPKSIVLCVPWWTRLGDLALPGKDGGEGMYAHSWMDVLFFKQKALFTNFFFCFEGRGISKHMGRVYTCLWWSVVKPGWRCRGGRS